VPADEWNALVDDNDPFMEHAFLAALEASGSVGAEAGAVPRFVLVREGGRQGRHDGGRLIGAMPLYLKTHSYGEFIFDWSWANAAHRSGVPYYPKLVAAVPFTPATGRRLLLAPDADVEAVSGELVAGAHAVAARERASSIQSLISLSLAGSILPASKPLRSASVPLRTLRAKEPSLCSTKTMRSPASIPRRLRNAAGSVTCPLDVTLASIAVRQTHRPDRGPKL